MIGSAEISAPSNVSFTEAVRVWTRIGLLSFGGPAGQIALMHRELVEQRRWISETRFLHALNYCMLLPGPEAQQLAIYIGWLMHRTWGGVVAGLLFIAPGVLVILGLSILYAHYHQLPIVGALFFGLKAAVLAIVVEAVVRIARRALKGHFFIAVALCSFVAIFAFDIAFPFIVFGAGVVGMVAYRLRPKLFSAQYDVGTGNGESDTYIDREFASGRLEHAKPNGRRSVSVLIIWLSLWIVPFVFIAAWYGVESVFFKEGVFFSQTAVVTFGGAYSVLSYVAQRAVEDFAWLRPGEMLDGLALAETTPGPLILVLQFVGYLAASRASTSMSPDVAGVLGSAITLWVTFVPCFLWIFLGAPYIEALRNLRVLNAALACITAAVVGVILNLSVWFALHTLFKKTHPFNLGLVHLSLPSWSSINLAATLLSVLALIATLRFKVSTPVTLAASALLGLAIHVAIL